MGITVKQKAILQKNGYTEEAINSMSYGQVSEAIGKILMNAPRKDDYHKTIPSQEVVQVEKVGSWKPKVDDRDRERSFKVSYAKDVAIAMLGACAVLKVDFRDLEVMKAITDNSIMMVGAMWDRL